MKNQKLKKLLAYALVFVLVFAGVYLYEEYKSAQQPVQDLPVVSQGQVDQPQTEVSQNQQVQLPEHTTPDSGKTDDDPLPQIDEKGSYTSAEDVALYIYTYKKLPENFITKKEAQKLGWESGGLDKYAKGKCIGGDVFGNREGILPEGKYYECDIDTLGAKSRGAKRLVFAQDYSRVYYTEDHYEHFTLLYGEE